MALRTKINGQTVRGAALDVPWGNTKPPKDVNGADEFVSWPYWCGNSLDFSRLAS